MDMKEKMLKSEPIFNGRIIKVRKDTVLCPNGKQSTREVLHHNGAVAIICEIDNKIVMEKQFRYPFDEVLLEIPAGKLDGDEKWEDAAIRELEEETGYLAKSVHYLGTIYPTVAYSDEKIHIFATNDVSVTNRHLDPDEVIDYYLEDFDTLLKQIKENKIKDSKTICAIQMYQLYKRGL